MLQNRQGQKFIQNQIFRDLAPQSATSGGTSVDVSGYFTPTRPSPIVLKYQKTHSGGQISTPDILFRLGIYYKQPLAFQQLKIRTVPEFIQQITINTSDVNQSNAYQLQIQQRPTIFRQIQALQRNQNIVQNLPFQSFPVDEFQDVSTTVTIGGVVYYYKDFIFCLSDFFPQSSIIKAFKQETITYTITLENLAIFYACYVVEDGTDYILHQLGTEPTALNGYNGGLLLTLKVQETIYQIREMEKMPRELLDVAPYQYFQVLPSVVGDQCRFLVPYEIRGKVLAGVIYYDFASQITEVTQYNSTQMDSTGLVLSTMSNSQGDPLTWPDVYATYLGIYDADTPGVYAYRDALSQYGSGLVLYVDQSKVIQLDGADQVSQYLLQYPAKLQAQNVFFDIGQVSENLKEIWLDQSTNSLYPLNSKFFRLVLLVKNPPYTPHIYQPGEFSAF